MNKRILVFGVMTCTVVLAVPMASGAPVTLKNDSYAGGTASLAVFAGLKANEGFGSILVPPSYPFKILKIRVLIASTGGTTKATKFTLKIYQDTPGSKTPGTKLHEEDVNITPSSTAISEIDVSSKSLAIAAGHIRVGFIQAHAGEPCIVRDNGPRKANRNLLYGYTKKGQPYTWYWMGEVDPLPPPLQLIPGNWIIRVIGETGGTTTDMKVTKSDMKVPQPDGGKAPGTEGGPCFPNGTCNTGLKCLSKLCVKLPDQGVKPDITGTKPDTTASKKDSVVKKPDGSKAPGTEGAACYPNGTCNTGLKCLSKLCVKDESTGGEGGCSVAQSRDLQVPLQALVLFAAVLLIRRRRHG